MLDIRSFDLRALLERVAHDLGLDGAFPARFRIDPVASGRYFGDAIRLQKALRLMLRDVGPGDGPVLSVLREPGGAETRAETCELVFETAAPDSAADELLRPLVAALNARLDGAGRLVVPLSPIRAGQTELPTLERAGRPMRVLIAEDDEMGRRVLSEMVGHTGAECRVVSDGADALAAWREGGWHIILMDVRMPGTDGLAATREIRAAEEAGASPRTPVVMLTAGTTQRQIEACLQAGADAVIPKPVQMDYLYSVLRRMLLPPGA